MNTYDERVAKYGGSPKPPDPRDWATASHFDYSNPCTQFPALQQAGASRQQKLP